VVVADRSAHALVKGVELAAARKMQHQELAAGLEMPGHPPQRPRLVAEMGERVET